MAGQRERGAVAVLAAITMLVLIGFAALAVDGGIAYGERRTTQNAADHAALAAAWAECTGGDPVAAAESSAAANGFIATDVVVTAHGGGRFTAEVTAVQDTTFGRAIGTEQITVASEATADCTANTGPGTYALFAGATSCGGYELNAPNADKYIDGGVHSNGDINSTGATATYTEQVTYVGTLNTNHPGAFQAGYTTTGTKPYPVPAHWVPATFDIDQGGSIAQAAQALGQYQKHVGNRTFTAGTLQPNRLYYVEGNVQINSGPGLVRNNVTIVATGSIHMAGASTQLTPWSGAEGLVLFSNHPGAGDCGAVSIHGSASGNGWEGIMYAPHGQIRLNNAFSMTLNGGLIGYQINLAGAGTSITKNEDYGGGTTYSVEMTK